MNLAIQKRVSKKENKVEVLRGKRSLFLQVKQSPDCQVIENDNAKSEIIL